MLKFTSERIVPGLITVTVQADLYFPGRMSARPSRQETGAV